MKIKIFTASTEGEAIEKVKEELGGSALILNIKKTTPRGLFKLFKKPKVEVIAAYEETPLDKPKIADSAYRKALGKAPSENEPLIKEMDTKYKDQELKIQNLEKMLISTEELMGNVFDKLSASSLTLDKKTNAKYENTILQLFYEELVKSDVEPEVAEIVLKDIKVNVKDDPFELNRILKIVYNRIVEILQQPKPIEFLDTGEPTTVVFIGPTGVGKTTTIAKIASKMILNDNKRVGMITADTYRIAAVEQLRTYADILGAAIEVVYTPEDMETSYNKLKVVSDVILVDTAGRSHKNVENLNELKALLDKMPNIQKYLVLSATTKYTDLIKIVDIFGELGEFLIIFTKLDETMSFGGILNICYKTGKGLSYVTDGQNVPDDIKVAKPELIAKALLGSFDK